MITPNKTELDKHSQTEEWIYRAPFEKIVPPLSAAKIITRDEICIIIPSFNEEKVIQKIVSKLVSLAYSVIVIDDGSTDQTQKALEDFPIYYIKHKVNLGQGAAIQTGITFAKKLPCQYFVTFDADEQHDFKDISSSLEYLRKNNLDIIFGSRFKEIKPINLSLFRKIILKIARWINFFVTGILLSDSHNGFRVMNRVAIENIYLEENGMAHATEFLSEVKKKKLNYGEFPVKITYSEYSKRKGVRNSDALEILKNILLNKILKK